MHQGYIHNALKNCEINTYAGFLVCVVSDLVFVSCSVVQAESTSSFIHSLVFCIRQHEDDSYLCSFFFLLGGGLLWKSWDTKGINYLRILM